MPSTTSATAVLQRLRAIADETRFAILNELASGERCVCELIEVLELKQPLLSFHLKILKDAELIKCRREGRWCYYSMHVPAIRELGLDIQAMVVTSKRKARACN